MVMVLAGDRVVSVNGESVGSRTYQEVVATIYRSPPTLQLLVVPREQDLLQQVSYSPIRNYGLYMLGFQLSFSVRLLLAW